MSIRNGKYIAAVAAALFCLSAIPRASSADDSKPVCAMTNDAVTAEYSQINDAVMKRDLDKIMSFLTTDFTEVNSTGETVNRDQERKNYQSQFDKIKTMTCKFDVNSVTPAPNGAYCDVTIHMDGIGVKRVMFMKLTAPFTNELVVHDLWVNTPDGWKIKFRQTLKNQTVITMN